MALNVDKKTFFFEEKNIKSVEFVIGEKEIPQNCMP